MKEAEALNGVASFHKTFGMPIEENPVIPAKERCKLRVTLLAEELEELEEAIGDGDLVEIADALCDLQYVLSGAILEFGLGDKFARLFAEVQRSNMSKACKDLAEAEASVKYYAEERDTEAYIVPKDDVYLIYRRSDDKVLKSVNYSPAVLETILGVRAAT